MQAYDETAASAVKTPQDLFPSLFELLGSVVEARIEQVMDASPWELGLTAQDLQEGNTDRLNEWQHIRAMVEAAYRLGLKDGAARLGDGA